MFYYDVQKHWTRRIIPVLGDAELNAILARDFGDYVQMRGCRGGFDPGTLPADYDSCDWRYSHRGPQPRFWRYVCHSACHWLVNMNLRLAMLIEPLQPWRIVTSDAHSTVWNGEDVLFDMNFLALDVPADEAYRLACRDDGGELPPGVYRD